MEELFLARSLEQRGSSTAFHSESEEIAAESRDITSLSEQPYGLLFIHANNFEQREFNRNFTSKWHFFQTYAVRQVPQYRFEMFGIWNFTNTEDLMAFLSDSLNYKIQIFLLLAVTSGMPKFHELFL